MKLRLTVLALAGMYLAGCANVQALKPTVYMPVPESEFIPLPTMSLATIEPLVRNIHVDPTPAPTPKPTPKPTQKPVQKQPILTGKSLVGIATWYCDPPISGCMKIHPTGGYYAAAGPSLRKALGPNWRGTVLTVCGSSKHHIAINCVFGVVLADWCACGDNHPIDLYSDVFKKIGPLYLGRVKVIIKW